MRSDTSNEDSSKRSNICASNERPTNPSNATAPVEGQVGTAQSVSNEAYESFVLSRVKPGVEIAGEITPLKAHLDHMALGAAGEVGELVDAIKRFTIYNKPLNYDNVIEELGDLEFYMQGIRGACMITRGEVLAANIAKLTTRYPKTYTDQHAIERKDKQT